MNKYRRSKSRIIKSYRNVLRMGNPNVTYKDAKRFVRGLGRMVKAVDQGLKNFGRRLRGAGWNVRRAVESLEVPKV